MKLVPDWRQAWRWFSVQALAAIIAFPIVWSTLPPEVREHVPDTWLPWIMLLIAIGGLLGRLKDQSKAPKA